MIDHQKVVSSSSCMLVDLASCLEDPKASSRACPCEACLRFSSWYSSLYSFSLLPRKTDLSRFLSM